MRGRRLDHEGRFRPADGGAPAARRPMHERLRGESCALAVRASDYTAFSVSGAARSLRA